MSALGCCRVEDLPQRLNDGQRRARTLVGMVSLATAYMASRHRSPSAALVAAGAGWFGLSHLVAAGTGYPGCPELGAIPSLLARREVRVGCVPWRIVDNRLGLAR